MTDEQKMNFLASVGVTNLTGSTLTLTSAAIAVLKAGGRESLTMMNTMVASICKLLLGRGLPSAAGPTLTTALKIMSGPVGVAVTALWAAVDVASPARRIIVPVVLYVGMLRAQYNSSVCAKCDRLLSPDDKFCPQCGSSQKPLEHLAETPASNRKNNNTKGAKK